MSSAQRCQLGVSTTANALLCLLLFSCCCCSTLRPQHNAPASIGPAVGRLWLSTASPSSCRRIPFLRSVLCRVSTLGGCAGQLCRCWCSHQVACLYTLRSLVYRTCSHALQDYRHNTIMSRVRFGDNPEPVECQPKDGPGLFSQGRCSMKPADWQTICTERFPDFANFIMPLLDSGVSGLTVCMLYEWHCLAAPQAAYRPVPRRTNNQNKNTLPYGS